MMTKIAFLAGALALSAGAAQAVTLDFDLGGSTLTNQWTLDYDQGGVDLAVGGLRCGTTSGPNSSTCSAAKIDRYSNGIGMNAGWFDAHTVDGLGKNEFLTLSFSPSITFNSVTFKYWDKDDNALFYTHNGSGWSYQGNITSGSSFTYQYDFQGTYTGSMFAIGATGAHSQWKLNGITVDYTDPNNNTPVVPLPAAGWMLLAGLGGLAAMKRRKAA